MSGAHDTLTPTPVAPRRGIRHLFHDLMAVRAGLLDPEAMRASYRPQVDPVQVFTTSLVPDGAKLTRAELVRDPQAFSDNGNGAVWDPKDKVWRDKNYGYQRRAYRQILRTHNTRLNVGRDQLQRIGTFGDVGSSNGLSLFAATGTATVPTATTWTGTGTSFPTGTSAAGNSGLQGHAVFVANALTSSAFTNPVIGVIMSNTATVLTVDQWYATPLTGAAGTTPAANSAAFIMPVMFAAWVALSTSSAAAAAADVTRSADGLWADGTSGGTATEQTANGLARAFCGQGGGTAPTIPGAGQIQLNNTWTYTGGSLVTIPKVVCFNSKAAAGTIPLLETLLNAQATVNTNGDTIQLSGWLVTF